MAHLMLLNSNVDNPLITVQTVGKIYNQSIKSEPKFCKNNSRTTERALQAKEAFWHYLPEKRNSAGSVKKKKQRTCFVLPRRPW